MVADAVDVIVGIIVAGRAIMAAPARTGTINERKFLIFVSLYADRLPLSEDGNPSHDQWLDACRRRILGATAKNGEYGRLGGEKNTFESGRALVGNFGKLTKRLYHGLPLWGA
jgi:hypothetical protein